jgi:hypothetical protein
MHLDTLYQVHSKNYKFRKVKTTYILEWMEYTKLLVHCASKSRCLEFLQRTNVLYQQ